MWRSVPVWFLLFCFLLWLLLLMAFGWAVQSTLRGNDRSGVFGVAALKVSEFPGTTKDVIQELMGRASGEIEDLSLRVEYPQALDYPGLAPVTVASGIDLQGVTLKGSAGMTPGWRLAAGAFSIDGAVENALLLISPELEVVRHWVLDEIPVGDMEPRPKFFKFVHGVEILPDGSVIFTFDGSISLQRFDKCGQRLWAIPGGVGGYHHAVTLDGQGAAVWTFNGHDGVEKVRVQDGAVLSAFTMPDIIAANPEIDILELRRLHDNDLGRNSRNTTGAWLADPFHLNDVDPLPARLADRFPGFEAGDLLISARSLNLVFVVDPDDLKVKWWRIGAVQRQHDPDWAADGTFHVFNNRMSRDHSEIVAIDPATFETRTIFDGRDHDFYTRIRGKQQPLASGNLVVTSPQQGHAFELGPNGDIVFEIANLKPGSPNTAYVISELRWLPPDYFDVEDWTCP